MSQQEECMTCGKACDAAHPFTVVKGKHEGKKLYMCDDCYDELYDEEAEK